MNGVMTTPIYKAKLGKSEQAPRPLSGRAADHTLPVSNIRYGVIDDVSSVNEYQFILPWAPPGDAAGTASSTVSDPSTA